MTEEWKDVKGFEGYYQISNTGKVRSLDRYIKDSLLRVTFLKGVLIKPYTNGNGYLQCNLYKNGVRYQPYIHKMVAESFIENHDNHKEVNHKDHIKTNNHVSNLEWCSRRYNIIKSLEFYEKRAIDNFCDCGERMSRQATNCSKCAHISSRKVERPTKEDLFEMIKTTTFVELGKMYGVSDNAVRKWCKAYDLPHKRKDINKLVEDLVC